MNESREFYLQMKGCRGAYRRLADAIHATMHNDVPIDAIDIGCGVGFVPSRLNELGWSVDFADDGVPEDLREQGNWITGIDLQLYMELGASRSYDCVICTETAEHIAAEYEDNVVENVADRSRRFVIWSAATPGQEWDGHVNLREPAYWLNKFASRGLRRRRDLTIKLRSEIRGLRAQHEYASDNFFVLERS